MDKAKTAAGKVSRKVWILILTVLIVGGVVLAVVLSSGKDDENAYQVLVTGMTAEETSAVMNFLTSEGITDYRLENNDTILVPTGQEPLLKAKLLMEGYPDSGFSYSTYYDKVGALSTESERSTAYLITLQERMGAVIRCFDGVKDAKVTITPGEDRTYVLDSRNVVGATAAVIVTMQDGAELTKQQAEAIRTLVSHSVQGLQVDAVAITDPYGNQFSSVDISDNTSDLSALKVQLENQYNSQIRTEVMRVLQPMFGEGNVEVGVHCTVDVNRTTEDSTTYRLPDGSEEHGGLINSRIYDHELTRGDEEVVGGVVGADVNADLPSYMEDVATANGDERHIRVSGQTDFAHDENVQHVERVAGYITDCTISVTANSATAAGGVDADWIRTHTANAAGISEEQAVGRISVLLVPFYSPDAPEAPADSTVGDGEEEQNWFIRWLLSLPTWVLLAAGGGLLLFIILLIVILVIVRKRRKKRRQLEEQQAAVDELQALMEAGQEAVAAAPAGTDVMELNTEKSMELRKDIRKFADENPEIAAQMIRTLLKGGDSDG